MPDLVALYDDPEIDRWTPVASPFGTGDARDYLAAARTKRADGHTVQLAITTDGRTALGEILLFHSAVDGRDVELAYGIGAAHRRWGLAAGAVRLMVDHALRNTRARRAVLRIEDGNTASEGWPGPPGSYSRTTTRWSGPRRGGRSSCARGATSATADARPDGSARPPPRSRCPTGGRPRDGGGTAAGRSTRSGGG
ncbi:GNAT family N-acetyltransferase [Streptomyces kaempferi]